MSNIAVLTDENGNFIGEKERHSLKPGDTKAIASLWVTNSNGEILLAKRSVNKKDDPGIWGPAAAGTLEPGETFESNIVKEAEEEIGLTGLEIKEFYRKHYWRNDGTGRYAVWFIAKSDIHTSDLKLQKDEVDEARWISQDQLKHELAANPENFVTAQGLWLELIENTGV